MVCSICPVFFSLLVVIFTISPCELQSAWTVHGFRVLQFHCLYLHVICFLFFSQLTLLPVLFLFFKSDFSMFFDFYTYFLSFIYTFFIPKDWPHLFPDMYDSFASYVSPFPLLCLINLQKLIVDFNNCAAVKW